MNMYIFRGKSATGKTTLTNILSRRLNVPVLRKDDIFDALSKYEDNIGVLNGTSYDILARQIQTCIDNQSDIIVDIALQDISALQMFLNKIDFKDATVYRFFCDCSNDEVWLDRWSERLENPLPNQYFKSIDEIVKHYGECEIMPLDNEIVLDSVLSIDELIGKVVACSDNNR